VERRAAIQHYAFFALSLDIFRDALSLPHLNAMDEQGMWRCSVPQLGLHSVLQTTASLFSSAPLGVFSLFRLLAAFLPPFLFLYRRLPAATT
jgi:hypothetical protein